MNDNNFYVETKSVKTTSIFVPSQAKHHSLIYVFVHIGEYEIWTHYVAIEFCQCFCDKSWCIERIFPAISANKSLVHVKIISLTITVMHTSKNKLGSQTQLEKTETYKNPYINQRK